MGEGKTERLRCARCGRQIRDGEAFWPLNGKYYCALCYYLLTGIDPYYEYRNYEEEEPDWLEENWWFKAIASG